MRRIFLKIWPILFLILLTVIFFLPVFNGKMPFPGDTLIGAYYPWRDLKWGGLETEYPLKNMTVSDITSSIYPWRYLAIEQIKSGKWPLWNNYEFSGTPLLANFYTAVFYPLNILFFLFSFPQAWTILVLLGPLLSAIFFYLFLKNKNLSVSASLMGTICFSFGSYFLNMLEFNIISHTILWIPLGLLAIDKLSKKINLTWFIVLAFSLMMSLLAGFVQFAIYGYLLILLYTFFRAKKITPLLILAMVISGLLSSVQLIPFLELLSTSGRINAYGDSGVFTNFFIPIKQLIMFFIPDYFGNPGTINYWGNGNYYEFCGYLGIVSVIFIIFLFLSKKIKGEARFWLSISLFALFFTINNPLSILPYTLKIPFFSALVPARLLFFTTFGFSILTAYGIEHFCSSKKVIKPFFLTWLIVFSAVLWGINNRDALHETIILRNSILPLIYLIIVFILFLGYIKLSKHFLKIIVFLFMLLLLFDLFRQGRKFLTFFDINLLYPKTETTAFLSNNLGFSRFMPLHQEIFGTNHQTVYGIEGIEGFCAYYNNLYGSFISLGQGYSPKDSFVVYFERTVFGRNYQANIFKLLSVKYFLSFNEIKSPDYPLVFQEGRTKIYENKKVLQRAFLACDYEKIFDSTEIIKQIEALPNPAEKVFTNEDLPIKCQSGEQLGDVKIVDYSSGKMIIDYNAPGQRILVTADIYYPGWKVLIDNQPSKLLKVDYTLRGVVVPAGNHKVEFIYDPESFKIGLTISLVTLAVLIGVGGWVMIKRK